MGEATGRDDLAVLVAAYLREGAGLAGRVTGMVDFYLAVKSDVVSIISFYEVKYIKVVELFIHSSISCQIF